jgi:predicted transposase/invertase (TIGR01784 family)
MPEKSGKSKPSAQVPGDVPGSASGEQVGEKLPIGGPSGAKAADANFPDAGSAGVDLPDAVPVDIILSDGESPDVEIQDAESPEVELSDAELAAFRQSDLASPDAILPPKRDFMFKLVFGDPNCLDPLVAILQAVLPRLPEGEFESITFLDTHRNRQHEGDKLCVLDLCVRLTSGRMVNIEIQLLPTPGVLNRMQYYNAKMLIEQIHKGQPYDKMAQVVTIFILDHTVFEDVEYHHEYRLACRKTGHEFPGTQEIRVLELPKLPAESDGTPLWKWLRFLMTKTREEMRELAQGDEAMTRAVAIVEKASADEKTRRLAFRRQLAETDMISRIQGGVERGRAENQAEVARRMLKKNMPLADIVDLSGLSEADVKRLAAEEKAQQ